MHSIDKHGEGAVRILNAPINLSQSRIIVILVDTPMVSTKAGSSVNAYPVVMSIATEATLIILNTDKQYRLASLVDVR
jgi:hypothetical protein